MEKNDLRLTYCRYYKGEETPPETLSDIESTIWSIERLWFNSQDEKTEYLSQSIDMYFRAGLADFNDRDGVPISLKSVLYNRYCQYEETSDTKQFIEFYNRYYQKKEA